MQGSSFLNPVRVVRAAKLDEGMQVADLSAGAGFFTRAAARVVGDGGVVWALDSNRELLPRVKALAAAEGLHNVEVMHGTPERVGGSHLPEAHFDLVIAANLLFSLEDKSATAKEAARILRRGGRVLLVDWKGSYGGLGPHESHVVSLQEARKVFEEQGFSFLEEVPAGEYHWGCIMKKK